MKDKNNGLIVEVTGSQSHKEYQFVSSFFRAQIDSVYDLYKKEKDEARKNSLYTQLESFQDKNKEKVIEYVEGHLNSVVSAYYMIFNTNDYNQKFSIIEKIFNGMGPGAKSSYYYEKNKK